MPYIRINDLSAGKAHEIEGEEVRFGRDPQLEIVASGEARKLVSGYHARVFFRDDFWWIEDKGSRNGTFLDGAPVASEVPAKVNAGATIRLGTTGPAYAIEAVTRQRVSMTLNEPIAAYDPTEPTARMAGIQADLGDSLPTEPRVVLLHEESGTRWDGCGWKFSIGRGKECEFRPVEPGDTSISRVHAQIEVNADGSVIVRDAGSRNGTLVNGRKIEDECNFAKGDRLQLGGAGPVLVLEEVSGVETPEPMAAVVVESDDRLEGLSPPTARTPRRSFGGKGATVFFQDMFIESTRKSKSRVRWVIWTFVVLLSVSVGAMYWVSELRVRQTEAQLSEQARLIEEQQAVADSLRRAAEQDYERLSLEFARASDAAAPIAVLDSLRMALMAAGERTDALEQALISAQESLNRELATGDSLRRQAQSELVRLRADLGRARGAEQPTGQLDSLLGAVRAAEERADNIEAQMRAVRGVDLASVSQASQGAIGLVTAFFSSGVYDGSGFIITASGYFVTNRHVVRPEGVSPDSLFVTMADSRHSLRADVVNVAESYGPDLAVLLVRGYNGPHLRHIDWTGSHMRQGEPAALIGFPAGMVAALDASRTVRTSMSAGIFSKVEPERVQFDGFTVGGSSGSPIFNANGEAVAVHRSGLREAVGLGFGVPISQLIELLPAQVKADLGLSR